MRVTLYGKRLVPYLKTALTRNGIADVEVLRYEVWREDTDLVIYAGRARSLAWHAMIPMVSRVTGPSFLVVGSDASAAGVLTASALYHAEKHALLGVVRWLAAQGHVANMVSPVCLSYSGGPFDAQQVADVCVDFALMTMKYRIRGQNILL